MAPETGAAHVDVLPTRGSTAGEEGPVRRSGLDDEPLLLQTGPALFSRLVRGWAEEGEEFLQTREGRGAGAGALEQDDPGRRWAGAFLLKATAVTCPPSRSVIWARISFSSRR